MAGDLLCVPDDVYTRTGVVAEPDSPEEARVAGACAYTDAVLRARFPGIPGSPVPGPVNVVATEVTVRYLGADPAAGGMTSETIGGYSYRRAAGMGSVTLTDEEMAVMRPYGYNVGAGLTLSNEPLADVPDEWVMSRRVPYTGGRR